MVADAPPIESALPAFLEFAAGLRAGGPQRAVRRRLPQALRRAAGPRRGRRSRSLDTAKLARRVITRDDAPNCKLSLAGRGSSAPRTTPNHRALSDARATVDVLHGLMERLGGLGVHTARGAADVLRAGHAPPSAASGTSPSGLPHAPGVYLFRDDQRPGPLRRHLARPAHPGAHLLHRLRDPHPDGRDGRARRPSVDRHRVRDAARGRGARAAADRRAQAALQPPLAVPREGALRQAHPRAVAAAVAGRARCSTTTPTTSARSRSQEARPSSAWPRCTTPSRSASAPTGSARAPSRVAVRAGRDGPLPLARATAASTPTTYAAVVRQLRDTPAAPARRGGRGDQPPDGRRWPTDERFEEAGVHRDRLAAFVRAAARTQRLTALTRCPEVVAARREDDGRWAVHVVRHGRLAAAGVIPPGADAHAVRRRAAAPAPRRCGAGAGPGAGRHRRGDREDPALAGVRRASAWSTSTASGPARSPAPPATSPSTTRSTESRLSLVPFDDRRDAHDRAPARAVTASR